MRGGKISYGKHMKVEKQRLIYTLAGYPYVLLNCCIH